MKSQTSDNNTKQRKIRSAGERNTNKETQNQKQEKKENPIKTFGVFNVFEDM